MSVTEMNGTEMRCTVRENYAWQDDILLIEQERETELDNRRMNVICYHFDIDMSELREWLNTKRKRKTNADRIRSMTDEELAEELRLWGDGMWTYEDWLDWLKEEVKE